MRKSLLFFSICLLISMFLVVDAQALVITPESNSLEVFRSVEKTFQLNLYNEENYTIYNISFSNVSTASAKFIFANNLNLSANESRTISYSILTNELFNSVFVSTISFFKIDPCIASNDSDVACRIKTVDVNISDAFNPNPVIIMANDSVKWVNTLSRQVEIRNLQGGFSSLVIPALSSQVVNYQGIGNYQFYEVTGGFTGVLNVTERPNITFVHDSQKDKIATLSLRSVLNPSALSVDLIGSLNLNNNQSTTGYLRITNNDMNTVITGIHLTADRWVTNFSEQDFTLQASTPSVQSSKLVSFTVQPVVYRTNDTNKSNDVIITLSSYNAQNFSKVISVSINFEDLDRVTINGTTYNLIVLGWRETIDACNQHWNDAGYEACKDLSTLCLNMSICKNIETIREIPAQQKIGEDKLLSWMAQMDNTEESDTRQKNLVNSYIDAQNQVNQKIDNVSTSVIQLNQNTNTFISEDKSETSHLKLIIWLIIITLIVVSILVGIDKLLKERIYYDFAERAGQI